MDPEIQVGSDQSGVAGQKAAEQPTYTRVSTAKLFSILYWALLMPASFYIEFNTSLKQGP